MPKNNNKVFIIYYIVKYFVVLQLSSFRILYHIKDSMTSADTTREYNPLSVDPKGYRFFVLFKKYRIFINGNSEIQKLRHIHVP